MIWDAALLYLLQLCLCWLAVPHTPSPQNQKSRGWSQTCSNCSSDPDLWPAVQHTYVPWNAESSSPPQVGGARSGQTPPPGLGDNFGFILPLFPYMVIISCSWFSLHTGLHTAVLLSHTLSHLLLHLSLVLPSSFSSRFWSILLVSVCYFFFVFKFSDLKYDVNSDLKGYDPRVHVSVPCPSALIKACIVTLIIFSTEAQQLHPKPRRPPAGDQNWALTGKRLHMLEVIFISSESWQFGTQPLKRFHYITLNMNSHWISSC